MDELPFFPSLLLYSPLCASGLLENMISAKSEPLPLCLISVTCGSRIRFYFGLPVLSERGLSLVSSHLGGFSPWPSSFTSSAACTHPALFQRLSSHPATLPKRSRSFYVVNNGLLRRFSFLELHEIT